MIEELRIGSDAVSADDKHVGSVKHIVIDTSDGTVTGLAIEPGFLASGRLTEPDKWDEPSEIIVPIDRVGHAGPREVRLNCTEEEFKAFPPYVDQQYVQPGEAWSAPPGYALGHFLLQLAQPFGGIIPPPMKIRIRKGYSEREISPDTPVWREDPHTQVGEVERLLFESESDRVTGLVIRRGGIVGFHSLLPMRYVTEILDDVIHVDMSDAELESLEPYSGGPDSA